MQYLRARFLDRFILRLLYCITMRKISEVLKNSKAHQITGGLVKPDNMSYVDNSPIMGYCALGVLACEQHNFKNYGMFRKWYEKLIAPCLTGEGDKYNNILLEYNVPTDLLQTNYQDELDFAFGRSGLQDLIYHLNDAEEMTFEQIGEFLEICLDL